jgi:hypothetical protein
MEVRKMARGAKKTLAQLVAPFDEKIEKKKGEIKVLEAQRAEVVATYENEKAVQIARLAEGKGISLDELMDMVKNK